MRLKRSSPFSGIKEEIGGLKRKNMEVGNEKSNPKNTARLCLTAIVIIVPAAILSIYDKNYIMAGLFSVFCLMFLIFSAILFAKSKTYSDKLDGGSLDKNIKNFEQSEERKE